MADSVQATLIVIIILLIAQIATFILLYGFMHKEISLPVAWKSLGKYVLISAAVAAVLHFTPTTTTLVPTAAKAIAGFLLYIGLLWAIDKQARELVRQVWAEILGNLRPLRGRKSEKTVLADENSPQPTQN